MINNNFIKKNTNFITSISAENLVYLEKTEQQNLSNKAKRTTKNYRHTQGRCKLFN